MSTRRFSNAAGIMALAATAALGGCSTNPVTGEQQLALVSEPQEIAMGREAAADVARTIGLVDNDALQTYVDGIGKRLAAASERPQLPWTFRVVDDPTPNAFALPGGYVFVTRGMMTLMTSEAELASVLGHEIGHVTARHSVSQVSRAQLAQLGLGLGMVLLPELQRYGNIANTSLGLLFLKYGRDAERQADELGFRYALEQNYDVAEMADVFAALQHSSELEGRSALPDWLATHPAESERIAAVRSRLNELAQSQQSPRIGRDDYLRRIDGLVVGEDPRQGFFHASTFYHPALAFQFTLPQGWKGENTTSAVVGVSPERDAAVQLTLADDASPEQAVRQFASRQGVEVGNPSQERIHGLTAVVTPFRAQADQTIVQGYAAFLRYDGRTYQFLAYSPERAFAARAGAFEKVIGSFAPVTDRRVLNVEPQRLDIVRLERSMSLAEFARRKDANLPLERLALINQIDDPRAPIAAGTLVKRVNGSESEYLSATGR